MRAYYPDGAVRTRRREGCPDCRVSIYAPTIERGSANVSDQLYVVVEIPRGSRNKYEYDEALGAFKLDRFLSSSVVYPTDYGYLPGTLGADGDPLDALVCVSEPTFPGCYIPVAPIALFVMSDEEGPDEKVLCVPCQDPNWNTIDDLDAVPSQLRAEIGHFFSVYKQLEGKPVEVSGWRSREDAVAVIEQAREHHRAGRVDEPPR
jgi:inorganic pyrophosphatase